MKNLQLQSDLRSLYNFTKILVEAARRSARHADKDYARDVYRYVSNSQILSILNHYENNGSPFDIDVSLLEFQMRELSAECHPLASVSVRDDFSKILSLLELIAHHVSKTPPV